MQIPITKKYSTGGDLNFDIVGGISAPTNPKENTIWIHTNQEIVGWHIDFIEPDNPEEGMIWLIIGTTNNYKINMLKENGIQVYPISAKQYIDGVWKDVPVKSYQNGNWVSWIMYLYNEGDECVSLTGGWKNRAWGSYDWTTSEDMQTGTLTKNSTNMTWSMSQWGSGVVEVLKDIDLTPFTTLHAELSATISSTSMNANPTIAVVSRNATYWNVNPKAKAQFTGLSFSNVEQIVPIEAINEKCDILIGIHTSSATASVTIHKVWLT